MTDIFRPVGENDPAFVYAVRNCSASNKLITVEHIHKIFQKFKLDARVNNIQFYQQALIHESYTVPSDDILSKEPPLEQGEYNPKTFKTLIPLAKESYDRLEFLGDRVLDLVIGDYIFHRFPDEKEGFLTDIKTRLVRGSKLCILAKKLKLQDFILISRRSEKQRINNDVLEDAFEAFLGAIYMDFGCHAKAFGICKDFVIQLLEKYLNFSNVVKRQDNYKKLLLEHYHALYKTDPKYVTISTYGPSNNRTFKAGVKNIDGFVITTGEGYKLIDAEQMAAKEALKYHGVQVYSDSEEPTKELYSDSESESL